MFTTNCTFKVGGEKGGVVEIPAGEDVTEKDLRISEEEAARYVGLGLLSEKPKSEKKTAEKSS